MRAELSDFFTDYINYYLIITRRSNVVYYLISLCTYKFFDYLLLTNFLYNIM